MKEGWKYIAFEECLQKVPKQSQVKSKDYLNSGKYPIVSQEAELISGYWNDSTFVYHHIKPVVIFGDHTKNVKYVDFDFVVGADGTHILLPKDTINSKFFFYVIKSFKLRELGYARHFKLLKEKRIPVPLLEVQQRIVDYLDSAFAKIDALKAKTKENLDNAHALFQAALKEMMTPKEGWEEKMLKDIGLIQTGTTPSKNDPNNYGDFLPFVRPSEIDFDDMGHINPVCEISLSKQGANIGRRISANSVLMVCIGATIGKVGYCETEVSCNQQINVITPYEEYDQLFVYYAMSSRNFKKKVVTEGTSAQATLPIINKSKWEQLLLSVPPKEEQIKVARALIELQRKVISMRQIFEKISAECDALKQSLLRQIFE